MAQPRVRAGGPARPSRERGVTPQISTADPDVSASKIQLHHLESSLQARDAAEEVRLALHDKSVQAEDQERRLVAANEQVRALQGESKSLRVEAKALDQALARSEGSCRICARAAMPSNGTICDSRT